MPETLKRYVISIRNGDGSRRYYFRRRGVPLVRLPDINDPKFFDAYQAAVSAMHHSQPTADRFQEGYRRQHAEQLHSKIKSRCVSQYKGVECTLSVDGIVGMMRRQNDRCAVSGLKFRYRKPADMAGRDPFAPSVDRIISRGHYAEDNVRVVLLAVNIGLNEWGDETFIKICRAVSRNAKR